MPGVEGRCRNRGRMWARMLAVLAVVAVGACGGEQIDVERMAAFPPDAPKATFVIVKKRQQDRAKTYAKFADQIARQLAAKGFTRVDTAAKARYALMFSYYGDGTTKETEQEYRAANNWKRRKDLGKPTASIALFDLTRPNQPGERVFGGWAEYGEEAKDHDAMVTAMIDAILKDFPGKSHETYSADPPEVK